MNKDRISSLKLKRLPAFLEMKKDMLDSVSATVPNVISNRCTRYELYGLIFSF